MPTPFEIEEGEGFLKIVGRLHGAGLIRSRSAFTLYALLRQEAGRIKPGGYELASSMGSPELLEVLVRGPAEEVVVRIPEGASVFEIEELLSRARIIPRGALVGYVEARSLEGKLLPDTYRFFVGSRVEEVTHKLLENFRDKAEPLFAGDEIYSERHLIIASLLEREVPDFEERRIVAGIIEKRLALGMPLQIDASVCYNKEKLLFYREGRYARCHPLRGVDFEIDSPYNTYLYSGLPPGPVGNPGLTSLKAAVRPRETAYLYYLSDPRTTKTIFAETFDEHYRNKLKYLN